MKILNFILFFFIAPLFADYNASKITKTDLENLQKMDAFVYEKSTARQNFNIDEIVNFVWEHRAIKIQPLLERFNLSFLGFAGEKSRNLYQDNSDKYENLRPYAYIGFQAEFKIIDPKEARLKKEEIRKQRVLIAKFVRDFQAKKLEILHLQGEIQILQEKENRLKIRVNEAVANFDERLENLETLHAKTAKLDLAQLEFSELKFNLLDFVKDEFKPNLERLLK
ncbi:hypothetical protein Cjcuy013_08740 [Campylobacter jejuni]|nr:hypothetical protein [Campylobacter jejuni]MBC5861718.1 hypothetical protein [Campylobacter jejuni]